MNFNQRSNDNEETNNENGNPDVPFFGCDQTLVGSPEEIYCRKCGNQFVKFEDLNTHFTSVKECHTLENEKYLERHMKKIVGTVWELPAK